MPRAREYAEFLEMDVYLAKKPFAIFVDKNFPQKYEFTMRDYSRPLLINVRDTESDTEGKTTMTAMLAADPDVALSCDYTLVEINGSLEAKVDRVLLQTKSAGFYDLNVDGFFDARVNLESEPTHATQVWYDGGWRDTLPDARVFSYEVGLPEVGVVTFDKKTGRWTSASEEKSEIRETRENGTR